MDPPKECRDNSDDGGFNGITGVVFDPLGHPICHVLRKPVSILQFSPSNFFCEDFHQSARESRSFAEARYNPNSDQSHRPSVMDLCFAHGFRTVGKRAIKNPSSGMTSAYSHKRSINSGLFANDPRRALTVRAATTREYRGKQGKDCHSNGPGEYSLGSAWYYRKISTAPSCSTLISILNAR
jgi:hypothetical protein